MKILFLISPYKYNKRKSRVDRVYGCNYGYDYKPAINFLLCATIAEKLEYSVRFLDCPAEGVGVKKFLKYVQDFEAAIVVFFTVYLSKTEDLRAAEEVSKIHRNTKFIFMGPYPTWVPGQFIRNNKYIVIRGEPENTFKEVIQHCEKGKDYKSIKGVSFFEGVGIKHNPSRELMDINQLPIPNRKLLKGKYFITRLNYLPITVMCVSRGCMYNCKFCAPNALDQAIELEYKMTHSNKPPLRVRSSELIIEEFKQIAIQGYEGIEFCDNQFIWDEKKTLEICREIKSLGLKWICYGRADCLGNGEVLKAMEQAGCELIFIGTDSFDQKILDDLSKEICVSDNYSAVETVRNAGIEPEISILLGASELETRDTAMKSINEARKLRTNFVHFSIAFPYPNTELYSLSKQKGWLKEEEFVPVDNARDAILKLPNISVTELKDILRKAYIRQYFSIRLLSRQLLNIRSRIDFKNKVKVAFRLIKFILYKR